MDRKEWGPGHRIQLTLSFILLNALVVSGCATLGDIESANERMQQSLNVFKKESRENQAELKKEIRALRKDIKNLKNTDQKFDQDTDKLIRENQDLRVSLGALTTTLQQFLNSEKRRYEEGLRWIEQANKSMVQGSATPSGASPQQQSASSAPPPPVIPAPAAAAAPAPSPPPETPTAQDAPAPSQPPGTPPAVAAPAPVTDEATIQLDEGNPPTIKIVEIVIDPPKVERNSKFTVTVKYNLETDPEGTKRKYLEQVVLLKGTLSIQNLKDTVEREPGTISYSQTIDVPAEAPTGVYTIKGVVSSGSARHSKIKTFVVK